MSQQCFFDWDNARAHTDALVSSWYDAHGVQRLEHAPYSPKSLDQDSFKNAWEGVARPLIAVAFAAAFRSLVAHCKKRVRLGAKFVEKS